MVEIFVHPVEQARRDAGLTQAQLAAVLSCSDTLISKAEYGLPIRRKFIERFLTWGKGALKREHFVEARPRKDISNGKGHQKRKAKRRRKARR